VNFFMVVILWVWPLRVGVLPFMGKRAPGVEPGRRPSRVVYRRCQGSLIALHWLRLG
jgi:hypothetical protein